MIGGENQFPSFGSLWAVRESCSGRSFHSSWMYRDSFTSLVRSLFSLIVIWRNFLRLRISPFSPFPPKWEITARIFASHLTSSEKASFPSAVQNACTAEEKCMHDAEEETPWEWWWHGHRTCPFSAHILPHRERHSQHRRPPSPCTAEVQDCNSTGEPCLYKASLTKGMTLRLRDGHRR